MAVPGTKQACGQSGSVRGNHRASLETSNKFILFRPRRTRRLHASRRPDAARLSFFRETFVSLQMPGNCRSRRVFCQRATCRPDEVQSMLTITPRAARVSIPMSIMYRRAGEEDWLSGKVVNLSESGVLFGPTELQPGHVDRSAAVAADPSGIARHRQAGLRGGSGQSVRRRRRRGAIRRMPVPAGVIEPKGSRRYVAARGSGRARIAERDRDHVEAVKQRLRQHLALDQRIQLARSRRDHLRSAGRLRHPRREPLLVADGEPLNVAQDQRAAWTGRQRERSRRGCARPAAEEAEAAAGENRRRPGRSQSAEHWDERSAGRSSRRPPRRN